MYCKKVYAQLIVLASIYLFTCNNPLLSNPVDAQVLPSYTVALDLQEEHTNGTYKKISLRINNTLAGIVDYTIAPTIDKISMIHHLHVEKDFRAHNGCGKMLLRHAVDDMLDHKRDTIELYRYPYDLKPEDDFTQRDAQLKSWYMQFGFEDKKDTPGTQMVLTDFNKFYTADVRSFLSTNGINFKFLAAHKLIQKA